MKKKAFSTKFLWFLFDFFHDNDRNPVHVVWHQCAAGVRWLLLWIPKESLREPGAHKPNSKTGSGASMVHEPVCELDDGRYFAVRSSVY